MNSREGVLSWALPFCLLPVLCAGPTRKSRLWLMPGIGKKQREQKTDFLPNPGLSSQKRRRSERITGYPELIDEIDPNFRVADHLGVDTTFVNTSAFVRTFATNHGQCRGGYSSVVDRLSGEG